ncbi:carbohydrate ABC transporter permease [Paenibacillus sp. JDR-2]|uniref:carbohydrate ABC transporter permease n=1 Tax=Paenibacillus sp. (strain JDR-2) TaxID=324057 RepID=UPI0001666C21|nr:sugar ABC transporter permease [Paenibacillus sp. JDR-2]ACT01204.1 binding-protein-dependent transport systems inner membrane component [Paenibacillus sp. JDR-2]
MRTLRSNPLATAIFVLPALIVFTVIVMYPLVQTLFMSLFDWDGVLKAKFVGLNNFNTLIHDDIFYVSLKNGFIFAVILTVFQLVLATVFALILLNPRIKGKNMLRRAYFIPVVLSVTVVCQLWISMYNPQYGMINKLFQALGLSYSQDWLSNLGLSSIIAVTMVAAWQGMGYQFALIYAAAKSLPEHFFEAAKIDGATTFQIHRKITIPLLAETYRICLIFTLNAGLNAFAYMQIMTKGGPGTSTYTLTYMMYRSAFKLDQYGYGCAVAVVVVLQCLFVTFLINKFVARERITY